MSIICSIEKLIFSLFDMAMQLDEVFTQIKTIFISELFGIPIWFVSIIMVVIGVASFLKKMV